MKNAFTVANEKEEADQCFTNSTRTETKFVSLV